MDLAGLICTDLLTIFSDFDEESASEYVIEELKKNKGLEFDDDEAKAEFERFVKLIVSEWEFGQAATPILFLISILCETGRTNVLLSPIVRASTKNKLESFLKTFWAFDMDPIGKKGLPKELSKKMGRSPLLRMSFALSALNRIYWYHHGKEEKSAMAAGVDEIFPATIIKERL